MVIYRRNKKEGGTAFECIQFVKFQMKIENLSIDWRIFKWVIAIAIRVLFIFVICLMTSWRIRCHKLSIFSHRCTSNMRFYLLNRFLWLFVQLHEFQIVWFGAFCRKLCHSHRNNSIFLSSFFSFSVCAKRFKSKSHAHNVSNIRHRFHCYLLMMLNPMHFPPAHFNHRVTS